MSWTWVWFAFFLISRMNTRLPGVRPFRVNDSDLQAGVSGKFDVGLHPFCGVVWWRLQIFHQIKIQFCSVVCNLMWSANFYVTTWIILTNNCKMAATCLTSDETWLWHLILIYQLRWIEKCVMFMTKFQYSAVCSVFGVERKISQAIQMRTIWQASTLNQLLLGWLSKLPIVTLKYSRYLMFTFQFRLIPRMEQISSVKVV